MKWITREHPRVDRVACPWLIEKFVDNDAEFLYVPADQVMTEARKQSATPYDVKDVELGHRGAECSFDAFVRKYGLDKDPAMAYMAKVIRGADTADKAITPESVGIEALLEGLRFVGRLAGSGQLFREVLGVGVLAVRDLVEGVLDRRTNARGSRRTQDL